MNQEQRKTLAGHAADARKAAAVLQKVITALNETKLSNAISKLHSDVTSIQEDEQEKFDNLTDGLQAGEKGQQIDEAIQALDGIVTELSNAEETFNNAVEALQDCSDKLETAADDMEAL